MVPARRQRNPLVGSASTKEWAGYFVKSGLTGLALGTVVGHVLAPNEAQRTSTMIKVGLVTGAVFLAFPAITMIRGDLIPAVDCDTSIRNLATKTVGNIMLGLIAGGAIGAAVPALTFGSETVSRHDVVKGGVAGAGTLAALAVVGYGLLKLMPPDECAPAAI